MAASRSSSCPDGASYLIETTKQEPRDTSILAVVIVAIVGIEDGRDPVNNS